MCDISYWNPLDSTVIPKVRSDDCCEQLVVLLSMGGFIYHQIYISLVPPSLAEKHEVNFEYPTETETRKGGVPANASVDFAFQVCSFHLFPLCEEDLDSANGLGSCCVYLAMADTA